MTKTVPPAGPQSWHPAWLPDAALAPLGSRRIVVRADAAAGPLAATVVAEVRAATERFGGLLVEGDASPSAVDLVLAVDPGAGLATEGYVVERADGTTTVTASSDAGLLRGWFHLVRQGEAAFGADHGPERHEPALELRMLDHWDNVDPHPVMGQVERGYAGGSIFYADGRVRDDLTRVREYARLLAVTDVNRVCVNNVNVHRTEARLLTDGLEDVARIADAFRPYGIRTHLAVSFAAPMTVGDLDTADPSDRDVVAWWAEAARRVYRRIPDFGGFVVKADSEGQPGPFAYGRDHADGANALARALAPFGGIVHWRAFVYDHRQDWRDRTTDRARAAYDHFAPLDGTFDDNVILQVKYGPLDFQVREPISPVLAAMPRTRVAVELQVTQEYTGHQKHAVYLAPLWHEVLGWQPWADGATVADIVGGRAAHGHELGRAGGIAAVSNVGDDPFWTGHPLAQANLYAYGRLAWDPTLDPAAVLDEWITLTFPGADDRVRRTLHTILDDSWRTYEDHTAPLGVGFMVKPGIHYGPDVDGYEYSPWGTYHFADRDGIGVDRTRASGTGYTGQYPEPWASLYESVDTCPDELLLFFHHVPYTHVLHDGTSVVQHVYDTHFAGAARAEVVRQAWASLEGEIPGDVFERGVERFDEQARSAAEWRDQLTTYFYRHSGVPDERGRRIY